MEPRSSRWNPQIHHAACEWFVEFRSGEPDEQVRRAFHGWLRESPAHLAAYLEVASLWTDSGALDPRDRWPREALIAEARQDRANVIPLRKAESDRAPTSARRRTTRIRLAALAATVVLGATGALVTWIVGELDTYATTTGEQRSLTLADGSTVQLNARSRLRVRFSARERAVELLQGQALFKVAKDVNRPFTVMANNTWIRAIGTQFDVYDRKAGTTITVLEGAVAIVPDSRTQSTQTAQADNASPAAAHEERGKLVLAAGEQLTVTGTSASKAAHPNIAAATAWTQRELVFDTTPLADVVDELNRYNKRQLVIADHSLEGFQIDGVFSSTDPTPLIHFLRSRPGIRVTETDAEIVISAAQ
jgi:transmembrane sensor